MSDVTTEFLSLRQVSFHYPDGEEAALNDLSISVAQGEFLVLCGVSGSGKSTLLRQLKPALTPHGRRSGRILFRGAPLEQLAPREQAAQIGFVQQNPDNQIVTDKVWHELAFGLENLGLETEVIRRRVAEMASFFGMEDWYHQSVSELSGGQRQLLNLASVMVMQPELLILDEPTGQLDPIAASDFLAMVGKINRELGTTVILTEHRLEEAFSLASRVAALDGGRLLCAGKPREIGAALRKNGHKMFHAMPAAMRVWTALDGEGACPVTAGEGFEWLKAFSTGRTLGAVMQEERRTNWGEPVITLRETWFRYEREQPDLIRGLALSVHKGEWFALVGGNGAGKTTSLKLMAGLLTPYRGTVKTEGVVAMLPQNPQALFMKKTVREDLTDVFGAKPTAAELAQVEDMAARCQLTELLARHPYDLSGGEQQRAALAKVLLTQPDILLLDEPTKGLDAEWKDILAEILKSLLSQGVTICMVSHDIEFCARYAHRCGLLFDGGLVAEGTTREFFAGNRFYTTAANRMAGRLIPLAIIEEDIIAACGGAAPCVLQEPPKQKADESQEAPKKAVSLPPPEQQGKLAGKTRLSAAFVFLLAPLTLLIGVTFFKSTNYYGLSMLILLECMIPFFMIFEGRKPQARQIAVIAVLCAIGVASRAALFMLPQFKPVMALTILAGVAFGGETGFLVGAMTMLASNVLFAQGPWTPWQMFAMGLIGFLAGILFQPGRLRRSRGALSVFGALAALCVYGLVMNGSTALMWTGYLNWEILLSYCISGFPMDGIQAVSTALFLWLAAEPMLEKLDRIKVKYGFPERK